MTTKVYLAIFLIILILPFLLKDFTLKTCEIYFIKQEIEKRNKNCEEYFLNKKIEIIDHQLILK